MSFEQFAIHPSMPAVALQLIGNQSIPFHGGKDPSRPEVVIDPNATWGNSSHVFFSPLEMFCFHTLQGLQTTSPATDQQRCFKLLLK